jgi:hypothetical protein
MGKDELDDVNPLPSDAGVKSIPESLSKLEE